ncbi:transposase [Bradyrhizobium sp. 172]|uniref:transposase n=1 Tax=Bradyrhizobium sp. 172 TaxID=2782643 RepID=UPI001FFEC7AD|nr:transposase [Bradyrhizobium sp. 172]UPJ94972.1 IS110 family transposase [Bradyrhizobium sp. 172]
MAGLDGDGLPLPCNARMTLDVLVNQLKELDQQVDAIERELPQIHKVNPVAKSLSSIPGICAIAATALVATAPDPTMFSAGREFAAWHGPTPKQNSTGGKDRFADRK